MANLACLELHPHPVRVEDLDHPDELRVDLDPVPVVEWSQVRDVERGHRRWPHTSGGRTSASLAWEEVDDCRPEDFTLATMPARLAAAGDRHAGIDAHPCTLDAHTPKLLAIA